MAIGTNLVKNQPSFRSGMIRAFDLFGTYDREQFDLSALDPAAAKALRRLVADIPDPQPVIN